MSRKLMTALLSLLCLLTALNLSGLAVNLSVPARATIAGMGYQKLVRDPDFTRAVISIVQKCKVNVDLAKLEC